MSGLCHCNLFRRRSKTYNLWKEQIETPESSNRKSSPGKDSASPVSASRTPPIHHHDNGVKVGEVNLNVNGEEGEAAEEETVDLPPPMEEIHTHQLPGQASPPSATTAPLSDQTEGAGDQVDKDNATQQIENIVKHRLQPECSQEQSPGGSTDEPASEDQEDPTARYATAIDPFALPAPSSDTESAKETDSVTMTTAGGDSTQDDTPTPELSKEEETKAKYRHKRQ